MRPYFYLRSLFSMTALIEIPALKAKKVRSLGLIVSKYSSMVKSAKEN